MAKSPPVIEYACRRRTLASALSVTPLCCLLAGDLALGLAWWKAAWRELHIRGIEGDPSLMVETLRYSFIGLGVVTIVACVAWLVLAWLRAQRPCSS
jgi:hypothetical protein